MNRMRHRHEMPSEDEILETKLYTLAKHLRDLPHCVDIRYMAADGMEYVIKEVIDLSAELHKKVIIVLEQPHGTEDTTVEAQSREGDVSGSGHTERSRAHASSVGPTTSHSGGPEEL